MKSYKSVKSEGTPEALIESASSELEEVREELESWMSNMEGTNLEQGAKYSMLQEAVSELENIQMPEPDEWPHIMTKVIYHESVPKRKNRSPSRQVRIENAIGKVAAVVEFYESLDEIPEDFESYLDELREIANFTVEIPGMYG